MAPENNELKNLRLSRIVIPALISLAIAAYFLFQIDPASLRQVHWTNYVIGMVVIAFATNLTRAFGYMWRLRVLTEKELSWKKCFQIVMLWEYASTITPGIVGGAAVAVFILHKEKLSFGRSTAIVLLTGFLDEVFFILAVPVFLIIYGKQLLFTDGCDGISQLPLLNYVDDIAVGTVFIYAILLIVTVLIGLGLFYRPRSVRALFVWLARRRMLRRWRDTLVQAGSDVVETSKEFKTKKPRFWIDASLATMISWVSRFALANCLVFAFGAVANSGMLVFARQFVIWMMMLVPTTPGGSGVAEVAFLAFTCEFFPAGLSEAVVVLWRTLSYTIYLLIGVVVLPYWVGRVFGRRKAQK